MTQLTTTYWLVFCVFLIFHHPATLALSGLGKTSEEFNENTDPITDVCSDWEEYDGVDCVCASDEAAKCTQEEGMVCDDKGGHYKSKCVYALQTCKQNVSLDSVISSCGACKILRLTGGNGVPQDTTRAEFRRVGPDVGLSTRYQSIADNNIEIFFLNETGSWAIGEENESGSFIAMMQVLNGSYPQDANPGMLVPVQNGAHINWELDSSFRLECADESEIELKGRREKRFIFTLIFAVVTTVTVATTTLKVVQAVKGCLYYPSVCRMRKEIKKRLLSEVRREKDRFLSTFGKPSEFASTADEIHTQLMDIQEGITTIPELHATLNISLSEMVRIENSIENDFPHLTSVLSYYDEWLSSVMLMARLETNLLPLEIMMSMPALVATSASTLALAVSGIGLVLAFGFAIVDLVSSIKEEKRVRDQLTKNRNLLISARNKLNSAFSNMNTFQIQFCRYIVRFFYSLSSKGKTYDQAFLSLYNFISQTYGHSDNRCNYHHIRSRINRATLNKLAKEYLPPVLSKLTDTIQSLKRKIFEVKETNAFLDGIKNKIKQNMKPADIFRFIKANKPVLTKKMFNNLFDLLKFISKSVLRDKSCYWGHNLDSIRRGGTTVSNYMQVPICDSNEISSLVTIIRTGVQNKDIPCKISRQVDGTVFRSRYHVIRFIADFILPNQNCYWGYDLAAIRDSSYSKDINIAKIDSELLGTLLNLDASGLISLARQIIQEQHSISRQSWQTFILCHAWQNQNAVKELNCADNSFSDSCFPEKNQKYQTC